MSHLENGYLNAKSLGELFYHNSKMDLDETALEEYVETMIINEIIVDSNNLIRNLRKYVEVNTNRDRFAFSPISKTRWIISFFVSLGLSILFACFVIIAVCVLLFANSSAYVSLAIKILWMSLLIFVINICVLIKSVQEIRFSNRYAQYYEMFRYKKIDSLANLSEKTKIKKSTVQKDLNKAVNTRLIPQGHFDNNGIFFMISDIDYSQYKETPNLYNYYYIENEDTQNMIQHARQQAYNIAEKCQDLLESINDVISIKNDKEIGHCFDSMQCYISTIVFEISRNWFVAQQLARLAMDYCSIINVLREKYLQKSVPQMSIVLDGTDKKKLLTLWELVNQIYDIKLRKAYQNHEDYIGNSNFHNN